MKAIAFNGSARKDGNTAIMTRWVFEELEKEGIETIRELRLDDPDVPVIAITGGGPMPPDRLIEVAKNLGANAGLSKPVDPDELTELALSLIREHREAGVAA